MKFTKRTKVLICLNFLFAAVGNIFYVAHIYFQSEVLTGIENGDMGMILRFIALAGITVLLYMAFRFLSLVSLMGYLADGVTNVRARIMKNILNRPIQLFHKQNDDYFLNLLGNDAELYRETRLANIYRIFCEVSSAVITIGMLLSLHPIIFLVSVVTAVLPLLTANLFTKATQKRREVVSQTAETFTGLLKEGVEGNETLRSNQGKDAFLTRFSRASEKKAEAQTKSALINNLSLITLLTSGVAAQLVSMGVGGYLAVKGAVSLATVYAALRYNNDLSNSLSNAMEYIVDFRASKNLVEKLKAEAETPCPVDGGLVPAAGQSLVYENVTFGFGDRTLYSDLSCTFAHGRCYAILGESGSGKSTLTKLLLRYYDDYEGSITLAGRDIRKLSEDEIYRVVGLVSQSPFLFNASLYENITMFTNDPPRDSAEYGKLLADLNLTALAGRVGDAPLGDFGNNISGGERQRINIARALRSHPSILIFDEPTTGLDPENVELIDQFIFSRTDVTRIVITHNWSEDYLSRFDAVIRIGEKAPVR